MNERNNMKKEIEIMDYSGEKTNIKIENFEDVVKLNIKVVSGDEILTVLYKNYETEEYDSCPDGRLQDYYGDNYCIYDITKNIDYIDNWNKRTSSYDYNLDGSEE